MKKSKIFMWTLGILSVIAVIAININLAKLNLSTNSLSLSQLEAMTDETVVAEYRVLYSTVLGENMPIFCASNVNSLNDLNNGCQSHNFSTTVDSQNTKTKYYYCMSGNAYRCDSGVRIYNNSDIQVGSTITNYVCKN
jgi:hypothetical protein